MSALTATSITDAQLDALIAQRDAYGAALAELLEMHRREAPGAVPMSRAERLAVISRAAVAVTTPGPVATPEPTP